MELTTNYSFTNSGYCFNFTATELTTNIAVTVLLHTLATFTCLFAAGFIIFTKLYQSHTYRLILYLMVATALYSITLMLEVVPVTHNGDIVQVREGWDGACAGISYISQMMESAKLTIIAWIVLYLLILAVFKFQANKLRHEVFGLFVVILVPLVKDWLPFVWDMYGLSGMWCWIKLTDANCGANYTLGLGLMFAVEYGPLTVVSIFTTVSFMIILVTLRKKNDEARLTWRGVSDNSTLKAGLPLIAFPLLYVLIFLFRLTHRIYYAVQVANGNSPLTGLWLAHTIGMGIAAMTIPTGFLCYPSIRRRLCTRCTKTDQRTKTNVYRHESLSFSKENTPLGTSGETDPFFPDETDQRDSLVYKSILSSVASSLQYK